MSVLNHPNPGEKQSLMSDPRLELFDLSKLAWNGRLVLGFFAAIGFALSFGGSFLVTPVYRGEALVVAVSDSELTGGLAQLAGELGGLAGLAGLGPGGVGSDSEELLAVLESRELGRSFIETNGLVDMLLARMQSLSLRQRSPRRSRDKIGIAYRYFDNEIRRISYDRKSRIIRVAMDWTDGDQAAEWANAYVALADSRLRDRALAEFEEKTSFLAARLESTGEVEVRTAIARLMESQLRLAMMASARQNYALRVLDPALGPLPEEKLVPSRALYALVGVLSGFMIGFIFLLLREKRRMD